MNRNYDEICYLTMLQISCAKSHFLRKLECFNGHPWSSVLILNQYLRRGIVFLKYTSSFIEPLFSATATISKHI